MNILSYGIWPPLVFASFGFSFPLTEFNRRNTRTSFIGKLLKRALSTRQGPCLGARYITKVTEGGVEESLCSENEDLYDEMYQELYQDVFQEQSIRIHCKKRQNTREKMGMIL